MGDKQVFHHLFVRLLITVSLSLLLTPLLRGQEYRGTVLGRVVDQKNAAIQGVTVKVTNEATSVSSSTLTGHDGAYNIQFLNPGTYQILIEMLGFKKYTQSGITVAIGQRVTVNATLEIGEIQESVNVVADASLLEVATGGMGQVVDRQKVESLPLNGRMIFMMNQLAQGVIWQTPTFGATGTSGLRPFDNSGGSDWSINGGRVQRNEFLLDGAPNSTRGRFNFSPPVDAVEEFKIQTNTYDAQYGRTGGGVINMTLKSGTNEFHAQLWEFNKYGAWQANNTLNNATGQPRPPVNFNQFGGTVTGPILKNKTFFMFTIEALRERVPFPQTSTVPTLAERAGDFSQTYADTPQPTAIYDPLTTTNVQGRPIRQQFENNRIPPDRINRVAQRILNTLYPSPTVPNQRLNNFVNPLNKAKYDYDSELVRIDHNINERHKIFGTYFSNHRDEFRSGNGFQGTPANRGEWPQTRNNHGFIFDWVYTINPTSLFNFRTGFTRFLETSFQTDARKFDRSVLGFGALPGQFLPFIRIVNGGQDTDIGVGSEGINNADNTASLQSNYSKTFSRHTMKFGGEYRNIRSNPVTSGAAANGFFRFNRNFTRRDANSADPITGNPVASFLLGYPDCAEGGGRPVCDSALASNQARSLQWHYWAFFFQDDFRVTPKLMLNLGLRWDFESPVTERYNRITRGFAFDRPSPLADQVRNAPGASECPACANLRGGLVFAGVDGNPRGLFDKTLTNYQPRIGFAYLLGAKTVIRGGFGIYFSPTTQTGPQTGFFSPTRYVTTSIGGRVGVPETDFNTFDNPFPHGINPAEGSSLGLMTQVGQQIAFDDPNGKPPYIYQFNLSLQREISRNLIVDISFVGSRSRRLAVGQNINGVSKENLARGAAYLQALVPNPFFGLLPGTSLNGRTIQREQLLRPYPQFTTIDRNAQPIGKSSYHSMQLRVEKRTSYGLSFISAYTLSKNIEHNNFLNAQDTALVSQLTDFDRTHLWKFSGVYQLPFGRGRTLGSDVPGWLDQVIGGWQASWIYTISSGRPLEIDSGDLARIGSAVLEHPTFDRWFNTCYTDVNGVNQRCLPGETPVWVQRQPFTLRTTPNRFDNIRRPWRPTLDFSMSKRFHIRERVRLEYRLETFNTLNTVIFERPNTTYTSPNFGSTPQPRKPVYFPRGVQMAFKLYL